MKSKLDTTREMIHRGQNLFPGGMVAWSGGKDSMAMLHIMLDMGIKLPVIFFKEFWQPAKYKFHDKLIRDWNLEVYSWHPYASEFQQNGDEFEVQNGYMINDTIITCPTGIVEPVPDLPWACSVDILRRPKQHNLQVDNLQAVWVGHKGCDSDVVLGGDAGTRIDARILPGKANMLFPIRDWTHEDVWQYIEENDVPFDSDRYEKVDGVWGERDDRRHNMDYVHACTACVDRRPDAPKFVYCPKLQMRVQNISSLVPWNEGEKLSYMED